MKGIFVSLDARDRLYFDIGGLQCVMHVSMLKQANMSYSDVGVKGKPISCLGFMELNISQKSYWLRCISKSNLTKKLSHGDENEDFVSGETLTGEITKLKRNNGKRSKVEVTFNDGRLTMMPRRFFRTPTDIDKLKLGDIITLQKTGYDEDLDQTIWRVVK